jgi:putative two-component system response regulator
MDRPRLLIIDDDEALRRMLARLLSDRAECTVAADVPGALRLFETVRFDLVLCDVNLPGTSGIELARLVLAEYPDTAVVMISGGDDPAVAQVATEYGAYGYIIKPFSGSEVRIATDNALRRRALEIENRRIREHLELTVNARTRELQDAVASLESSGDELRFARRQTIRLLSRALQYRDEETADHIERVSRYCAVLSGRLGLEPESMRLASAMHDVGKIGVPDRILRKPGPLTPDERIQMERHADIGHQILGRSGSYLLDLAASVAWTHHERWDGTGYPRRLAGEAIPLEGRIAAVADVFDALTSDRVYRDAMPVERAVEIMRSERGEHFDPGVLDAFLDSLDETLVIKRAFAEAQALPAVLP